MHAAAVIRQLRQMDPTMHIAGVGGPAMEGEGVYLLADQSQMKRVGMGGYVMGIPYHAGLALRIRQYLQQFKPDGVLLVDYGGFNLRLASLLKRNGYKVYYFIPPQVWASRRGRLKQIQRFVDHVFCIFPFEQDIYTEAGIAATYVGHPLVRTLPPPVDRVAFCQAHGLDPARKIVALLPGSRQMEIDYLLGPMLATAPLLWQKVRDQLGEEIQFVIPRSSSVDRAPFDRIVAGGTRALYGISVKVLEGYSREVLSIASLALVASGTATLEAALYHTPMVIVYRGSWLAYQIARRLIYLPCIGLPNILTSPSHPIVPELLQDNVQPELIQRAAMPFFDPNSDEYQRALQGFQTISRVLGEFNAPEMVASKLIQQMLIP
jgi:lipid-A-disaccharide synthase